MIIVIDNYDSFTFNLVQLLGSLDPTLKIQVYRNDQIQLSEIESLVPEAILLSPGPGNPQQAGICIDLIRHFYHKIPLLGICLGHQCIASAFGGIVHQAKRIVHGKVSSIFHQGQGILAGIPSPFKATRYHSLIVDPHSLTSEWLPTCFTKQNELMGIQHQQFPVYGLQFHPESFLTKVGPLLLQNFLQHLPFSSESAFSMLKRTQENSTLPSPLN